MDSSIAVGHRPRRRRSPRLESERSRSTYGRRLFPGPLTLIAMALQPGSDGLLAMAFNLLAMASTLIAMASNLIANIRACHRFVGKAMPPL